MRCVVQFIAQPKLPTSCLTLLSSPHSTTHPLTVSTLNKANISSQGAANQILTKVYGHWGSGASRLVNILFVVHSTIQYISKSVRALVRSSVTLPKIYGVTGVTSVPDCHRPHLRHLFGGLGAADYIPLILDLL